MNQEVRFLMKVGIVWYTTGGNTTDLADVVEETVAGKADVYRSEVEAVDKDELLSCDAFAFGCPAQGAEELSPEMQDLMDEIAGDLAGKPVIIFGSYGWGGGEYAEQWRAQLEGAGVTLAHDQVCCLETPDDEAKEAMKEAAEALVA